MSAHDAIHSSPDVFRKAYLTGSRPGLRVPVREVTPEMECAALLCYVTPKEHLGLPDEFTRLGSRIYLPVSGG